MTLEYYKVDPNYKKECIFPCPNNAYVVCTHKNCYHCGWNPTVAKMRMDKILKERGMHNG